MTLSEALEVIARQQRLIEQLQRRIAELEQQVARQAAPFRRDPAHKIPPEQQKPPGRKPGHPGARRAVPRQVDQVIDVPLPACPRCGGELESRTPRTQFIEEIPPLRPVVTRLTTWWGKCPGCGIVETTHPLQTSRGQGAAGVQLGPRARSLLILLTKHLGVTTRKAAQLLQQGFGLSITPGGIVHNLARSARQAAGAYHELIEELRGSPVVYADETSWWVGGPKWWLWAFTTPRTTVYRIEPRRSSQVVQQTLGDYQGLLTSDCLASYDPPPYRKHKCVAHHLQAIRQARDRPDTTETKYLDQWRVFFQSLLSLTHERTRLSAEDFARRRAALERRCDELLAEPGGQSGDVAVRHRLAKQRAHVLGCLDEPTAEATNNRAERALRPAVVARKVSCGNRTEEGKRTFEILTSLVVTYGQRGLDLLASLIPHLILATPAG